MSFKITKILFQPEKTDLRKIMQVLNKESNDQFGVKAKFRGYETVNLGYVKRLSVKTVMPTFEALN